MQNYYMRRFRSKGGGEYGPAPSVGSFGLKVKRKTPPSIHQREGKARKSASMGLAFFCRVREVYQNQMHASALMSIPKELLAVPRVRATGCLRLVESC